MVMEGFIEYKRWNRKKLDTDNSVPESKGQEKFKKLEVSSTEERMVLKL